MQAILESSKIFLGSRYKDRILAAAANPINQPLVKQIESWIPEDAVIEDKGVSSKVAGEPKHVEDSDKSEHIDARPKGAKPSSGPRPSHHASPAHFEPAQPPESELGEEPNLADSQDTDNEVVEEIEEVTNSSKVSETSVNAATYVTVENVAEAVNEIPGTLNLREDTAGVTQAILKGDSNELWIYYKDEVDISDVIEHVNLRLSEAGYYFLSFNRMNRDNNAIIFSINWVSNYFNPALLRKDSSDA